MGIIVNPYIVSPTESYFTVGTMSGSVTLDAETGWQTKTTHSWGDERQINKIRIQGTYSMDSAIKGTYFRIMTTYNEQLGSQIAIPQGTSAGTAFDTGEVSFTEKTAAGVYLQMWKELLYTPYPTAVLSCDTNQIWEA